MSHVPGSARMNWRVFLHIRKQTGGSAQDLCFVEQIDVLKKTMECTFSLQLWREIETKMSTVVSDFPPLFCVGGSKIASCSSRTILGSDLEKNPGSLD